MKAQFSLALLATAIQAGVMLPNSEQTEFLQFAGKFNKHFQNTKIMEERMECWRANKERVAELKANGRSKAIFELNETADLTDSEFLQMQGIKLPEDMPSPPGHEKNGHKSDHSNRGGNGHGPLGRHLQSSLNWATGPHGVPVKNQGGCGSCWAFAATTVQETMQSKKTGNAVERLSEQEGVDCDGRSYGCNGGWMHNYWIMSKEIGSQSNVDYPYEAQDNNCRKQGSDKRIASKAGNYGWVGYSGNQDNIDRIKDQLQDGPLSIAVSADYNCWRFYSGGVLTTNDSCATNINHGVVLTGYDTDASGMDYWIVQNSWGTGWGDGGFVHMQITDGVGISGMNQYVQYVDVQEGYPPEDDGSDGGDNSDDGPLVPGCDVDEKLGPNGAHTCWNDDHCHGFRECSAWGWCHGKSYCDADVLPDLCDIDESTNERGPNRCYNSMECHGDRTCSIWGWCEGVSNC